MYIAYYVSEDDGNSLHMAGHQEATYPFIWLVCSESELFVGSLEELLG